MKKISIGIAIIAIVGAFAAPAAPQAIPPWEIGDQAPPESDRTPADVNPFTDTLYVTLNAADATHIYYDINNDADFDPESATEINPNTMLPVLTATSVVRAVAYSPQGRYSGLVSWTYTKSVPPENTAPSVALLTPLPLATFIKGNTYSLTATALDPDGPVPLTVKYQYSQAAAGTWIDIGTGTGEGFGLDWTIGPAVAIGATQLRAVATDGNGASANHQIAITVVAANVAPTVSISSPANNSSFTNPTTIALTATPADPGGAITKVEFYRNAEATPFATAIAAPWTYNMINPPAGSYSVTAVAYDNGSPPPQLHTTSAAVSFTVAAANRPPKPVITFPENGKSYYAPFSLPITAAVTDEDPNSSITKVVFRNGNTVENVDVAAPWSYEKPYPAGSYRLTATATDDIGDSAVSDTVRFTVAGNLPPVARAGVDTGIIWSTTAPTTVALKGGTSSDPEGTLLGYEWTGPAGVIFTGGATATPTATFSTPGTFIISLKVTDQGSPPASGSDEVIVTVNSRPAINSPLNVSGTAATRFGYLMTATGYPAPTLSAPTKPAWLTQKTGTDSLIGTPPASGPVTVTVVATNPAGTDTKTLNISISDSLSRPVITSLLSGTAKTGAAYSYTITARGNPSPVFTVSSLPGGLNFTAAGGLISGTPTVSGPYTINLTATNSQGTDTKPFVLTINSDPRITTNLFDSVVVTERSRASFEIRATGYPAVNYEWQYSASATGSFSRIGANSSIYAIESTTMTSTGYYRVIVRNGVGPDAISKACRLKVNALPIPISIVSPRMGSPSVVVGTWVPFKVKATGPPKLMFQWFKGSTAITVPKEQDTLFIIQSAALTDAGEYYAKVMDASNPAAYKLSDTARLSVQLPKLPKPYARPAGGPFYPTTKIAFGDNIAGTEIFWTNNGSDPSRTNGFLFTGDSILVDATRSFKARAYKANFQPSDISFDTYTLTVPGTVIKPQIRPLTPNFKVSMNCTLSTWTPGATIYYTKDPAVAMVPFGTSITLDRTTTIIAVARAPGMISSDTLRMTYIMDQIQSKVLTPTITAVSGDFTGSTKVALDCATDNSLIYYTTDGSSPDSSATRILYVKEAPFTLTATTYLRVVATRQNYLNSDIVSRYFRLIPGPITASVAPDFIFEKDFIVNLTAHPPGSVIRYTTEGNTPNAESPEFPAEGLIITNTTTISAIAIMDGVSSTVYSFSYTKKGGQLATPTPTTANNQSTFKDTTIISLYSTPGSKIYYTLNGEIPTAVRANEYTGPFVIDTTVTLQAVAVQAAFGNSKILVANYTLVPERPIAITPGGSFPNAITVKLKNVSRRAKLYYTTDGSEPMPSNWSAYDSAKGILINADKTIKAIAVAGNMASQVMEENYVIFGVQNLNFTLPPGQTAFLEGGYTLRNPEDQSATVQGRIADAAPYTLVGFDGVQYILSLSLSDIAAASGVEFPKLIFTSPSSDKRSMYKIDPSGRIYFLSGADTVSLQQPGTYFMGIDVAPPAITHRGQAFVENGFTQVTFQIDDNVANLSYDVRRNDDPVLNLVQQPVSAGQSVSFKLKHPAGTLKPLYIQLVVSDYRSASFFPPDPGTQFPLSQKLLGVKSPDSWFIGTNPEYPFDFLSIPLSLATPLTLKDLRAANSGAKLEGVAWVPDPGNPEKGKYLPIPETETIRPGQAYWVGSRTRISSLSLASAETVPTDKGVFSVFLKTGWNQIANPHLEELYWPYSRTLEETYKGFAIKGLWEYIASEAKFRETESLKPWRGYYVYNFLGDTSVTLSPRPITVWAMKKQGNAGKVSLSMGWGGSPSLRLGADFRSSDGLGREDEFALPRHKGELSIRALRDGANLNSDWVRLRSDGIQEWKIAMDGAGDSLPSLRILTQELPDGHETWAVSLSRSMKFRLEQGRDIPASGLAKDTLLVYSGHKDLLARFGLLQRMAIAAPSLDLNLSSRNGGFTMRMFLPSKARIQATVWSLQGGRLGELALGPLSGGEYGFAFESDFRNRPARLAPGIYFLSLDVRGPGLQKRLARKFVIRD